MRVAGIQWWGISASLLTLLCSLGACKQRVESEPSAPESPASAVDDEPEAPPIAPQKKGMVWIPKGELIAGTPPSVVPRIADEELPGTALEMNGFYIDLYPYPNEPGGIPTTNLSRDEAEALCAARDKRLCTELEWERACKGAENTTYEYGDTYRQAACGTGIPASKAASRTNGEYPACKSSYGVMDMHGGVWEWTQSTWEGRKAGEVNAGVLRGGNATSGELVGRCANSLARSVQTKESSIGFRCCAGERNSAVVQLSPDPRPSFERLATVRASTTGLSAEPRALWGATAPVPVEFYRAWHWRPVADEDLIITSGCEKRVHGQDKRCGVVIARIKAPVGGDAPPTSPADIEVIAEFSSGPRIPDLIFDKNEPSKLRARSLDIRGTFARDFVYSVGRVSVLPEIRP